MLTVFFIQYTQLVIPLNLNAFMFITRWCLLDNICISNAYILFHLIVWDK